jgi:ferrous-iron efflux pump FieF
MIEIRSAIALKTGLMTIALSSVLVVIKSIAFALSGSVAILASLTDSIMDIAISTLNYCAIRYSAKPADEDHRYGHGKIEGLAALGQAILIGGIASFLIMESFARLGQPQELNVPLSVLLIMLVSLGISILITFLQNRAAKQSGSLAIEADRAHYNADAVQHCAVILAILILQIFGGPLWIDSLFGVAVALWMLWNAREIAKKGLNMILDRELPQDERKVILSIIKNHNQVLGVHDLRTIRHGMKELISFDIEADPHMSLEDAHAITKDLEQEILEFFPGAEIMIHVDPHGEIEDSRHTNADIHH